MGTLKEGVARSKFILFDEFNLSRPERYLAKHFHYLDNSDEPTWIACATLNIDETSRPPAPKVFDRCFLVEIDAPRVDSWYHRRVLSSVPNGTMGLLQVQSENAFQPDSPVERLLNLIETTVTAAHLRSDLLPSYRLLNDIRMMQNAHAAVLPHLGHVLDQNTLYDHLVASRVLGRITGPADELKVLIQEVKAFCEAQSGWSRSMRRLAIAESQSSYGFVSPWQ